MRTSVPTPAYFFLGIVLVLIFTILVLAASCTDSESILSEPTESSIFDLNEVLGQYEGTATASFEEIEMIYDEENQTLREERIWREYLYRNSLVEIVESSRTGEFRLLGNNGLNTYFLPYDLPWQSGSTFYYYTPFEPELEVNNYAVDIRIINDNMRIEIEYFDNRMDGLKTEFVFEGEKIW